MSLRCKQIEIKKSDRQSPIASVVRNTEEGRKYHFKYSLLDILRELHVICCLLVTLAHLPTACSTPHVNNPHHTIYR